MTLYNSTGGFTPSRPLSGLQVIPDATREETGVLCFPSPPGSQASSRGEAKDSALLSSRDGYVLEPTEWPTRSKASCGVGERTRDCSPGHAGREGPQLAPRTPPSSRVATRVSWSPLSGLKGVQPPLPLRQTQRSPWGTPVQASTGLFMECSQPTAPPSSS